MINREFWNGKRVFITGHTGFQGSWLALWLQSLGAELTGFALQPPSRPSLFELAQVAKGMTSIQNGGRDLAALRHIMAEFQPEIVFHIAAQPRVRCSDPALETYSTNPLGTVQLLEAVHQTAGIKAVVNIISGSHENCTPEWGREEARLGDYDSYSRSKYVGHGVALATARAGSLIGGGDWTADRLIPDILQAMLRRESVLIRSPQATRPWQHVLDPLHGYLMLAERLYTEGVAYGEDWNFGPDQLNVKPAAWIADQLCAQWGGLSWQQDGQPETQDTALIDSTKARAVLGWTPRLDLKTTLQWLLDWTRAYQNHANMRYYSEAQIKQFMQLGQPQATSNQISAQQRLRVASVNQLAVC